jgi:hypothetical protein
MQRRAVVLDHNFPEPILQPLDRHLKEVAFFWVRDIGEQTGSLLQELDDDLLIYALHRHRYQVLVTTDWHMIHDPAVLVALHRTRLTLFTIEKAGGDPLIATGALLRDLLPALRKTSSKGQVFRSRPVAPRPTKAYDLLVAWAEGSGRDVQDVIDQHSPG